mmetsp:Transcript_5531/g.6494  ORF Transcript_5531/g.6494 Transcript_5531/m.6494 type:complete len:303 (-) Transcript_5531:1927-2835(-)
MKVLLSVLLLLCSYFQARVVLALEIISGFGNENEPTSGSRLENFEEVLTEFVPRLNRGRTDACLYNQALAEEMVAYASAASCANRTLIEKWKCKVCLSGNGKFISAPPPLSNVIVFEDKQRVNQAFVGFDHNNKRIIVSFQGTVNVKETLEDLDVIPVKSYCVKCKVHSGFFNAFQSIGKSIISIVGKYSKRYKSKSIFLTGHSLGAAMACHAALHLHEIDQEYILTGYTFGQPRLGNKHFSYFMREKVPHWFRIVNFKDPIPALVPKIDSLFYHTTTEGKHKLITMLSISALSISFISLVL